MGGLTLGLVELRALLLRLFGCDRKMGLGMTLTGPGVVVLGGGGRRRKLFSSSSLLLVLEVLV